MGAPVEVGESGIDLQVSNGLLEQHQTSDRQPVRKACLAALEQWTIGVVHEPAPLIGKLGRDGVLILERYGAAFGPSPPGSAPERPFVSSCPMLRMRSQVTSSTRIASSLKSAFPK